MSKSYLSDAQHHAQKIQYFFDQAGTNAYSQAQFHYFELGKCYANSGLRRSDEAYVIHTMYVRAGELIDQMNRRENQIIPTEDGHTDLG